MTKKKIHQVKFLNGQGTVIEIDGQTYKMGKHVYCMKDGIKHIKYTEFKPFNMQERNKVLKEIGKQLRTKIQPERVVEEMFKNYDTKELKSLNKKLEKGEIKAKATDGCYGLTFHNTKKNKKEFIKIIN